ncbi:MAG: type II toxin-antitoxin system PemK/MazF family toxin [Dehalococcoidia bacterium]
MKPAAGSVVLVRAPGAPGTAERFRPALVLGTLPGSFQSVLLCGISTSELDDITADWDEIFEPGNADFKDSGLQARSAARLSFLFAVAEAQILELIGSVDVARVARARERLAGHLVSDAAT